MFAARRACAATSASYIFAFVTAFMIFLTVPPSAQACSSMRVAVDKTRASL